MRTFQLIEPATDKSRAEYHGARAAQAALKAFNWYCRQHELGECELEFTIQEIGNKYKKYNYIGTRHAIPEKIIIRQNGRVYAIKFQSSVHKASPEPTN